MGRLQFILILFLVPLGALYYYMEKEDISVQDIFTDTMPVVRIGDAKMRIEIADSEAERSLGLSGRKELDPNTGLLFVFPEAGFHGMWMKDMNFPIDIIWIDEALYVIGIEKNIYPDTYPKTFRPSKPALYAIETNIHYSDALDIHAGDNVNLPDILKDK
jgi:uncharacterized membrane protein (UPF0127 family)